MESPLSHVLSFVIPWLDHGTQVSQINYLNTTVYFLSIHPRPHPVTPWLFVPLRHPANKMNTQTQWIPTCVGMTTALIPLFHVLSFVIPLCTHKKIPHAGDFICSDILISQRNDYMSSDSLLPDIHDPRTIYNPPLSTWSSHPTFHHATLTCVFHQLSPVSHP